MLKSAQEFFDESLAYKEFTLEYYLTQQKIRVLFYRLILIGENILIETCSVKVFLLPIGHPSEVIEQSNRTADGPAVFYYFVNFIDYYNYNEATVGLFFVYFEEILQQHLQPTKRPLLHRSLYTGPS